MTRLNPYALLILLFSLMLDQFTKLLVTILIPRGSEVEVLPFLTLVHLLNPGASFSFLADQSGWQRWFFTFLGIGVSAILGVLMSRQKNLVLSAGYGLIIAGALGNVIDRLWRGAVVDWLDFFVGQAHWPAFNIADSSIFCGVAILLYTSFSKESPTRRT